MQIHPVTLKSLRERHNLSQQALAETAGVNKKTISRIEARRARGSAITVNAHTAKCLARALRVDDAVLAKEPDGEPGEILKQAGYRSISGYVDADTALAYAMVEYRYGTSTQSMIEMAPLLFTLLAEGCLAWRRARLAEIDEAIDRLKKMDEVGGHLSFTNAIWRVEEGAFDEQDSIRKRDLFGKDVAQETYDLGYDPAKQNPFADYLRYLAKEIDDRDAVELDLYGDKELWNMDGKAPNFRIGGTELDQITGQDPLAEYALKMGHARIGDIPAELRSDAAQERRVAWLRGRVPGDVREAIENPAPLDLSGLLEFSEATDA